MLPFDLLAEINVIYPVASNGSPPFQNTFYYEPATTPADAATEVANLAGAFKTEWDTNIDPYIASALTGIYMNTRIRQTGFIYEDLGRVIGAGNLSGSLAAGGASARFTFISQKRVGQRNGGIYVPGVTQSNIDALTGAVNSTWKSNVASGLVNLMTVVTSTPVTWNMVTLHKYSGTESGYEGSPVNAIGSPALATYYDSRYR